MDERILWFIDEMKQLAADNGKTFKPPKDIAEQIEERAGAEGITIPEAIVLARKETCERMGIELPPLKEQGA